MRLTIAAGVIMGIALGVQSAHDAHLRAGLSQAAGAVRVHVSAPWYVASDAGSSASTSATVEVRPRDADLVAS
jgi:hypothetical protein